MPLRSVTSQASGCQLHKDYGKHGRGEIVKLEPAYRPALARDGYVLVRTRAATFQPEA